MKMCVALCAALMVASGTAVWAESEGPDHRVVVPKYSQNEQTLSAVAEISEPGIYVFQADIRSSTAREGKPAPVCGFSFDVDEHLVHKAAHPANGTQGVSFAFETEMPIGKVQYSLSMGCGGDHVEYPEMPTDVSIRIFDPKTPDAPISKAEIRTLIER